MSERTIESALLTHCETVETPPVDVIYERAGLIEEDIRSRGRRRIGARGKAAITALLIGCAVPAATAATMLWDQGDAEDPLSVVNPDDKFATAPGTEPRVPVGEERVGADTVSLTVLRGERTDRSCFAVVQRDASHQVVASIAACGGGDGETYAENSLGVGLVQSGDKHATRIEISGTDYVHTRPLKAGYALTPQLPVGEAQIRTFDASGHLIATHHVLITGQ